MKMIFAARVIVISPEMVILLMAWLLVANFESSTNSLAASLDVNEDLVQYLIFLPLGLIGWIAKEAKDLIFADAEHAKQLVNWPDYWRLKVTIVIAFAFAVVFLLMAAIPWLSKSGISTGNGLVLFVAGIVGTVTVATSVYFAHISVKEIFHKA